MDTKLLGLILQGDKRIAREITEFKNTLSDAGLTESGAIVQTAVGESIITRDSSDDGLKGLRVFGKSEQFSTSGANLLELKPENLVTKDGFTSVINEDGSLTINGIGTRAYAQCYKERMDLPVGTYYISCGGVAPYLRAQFEIKYSDGSAKYPRSTSFTIDGTEVSVILSIQIENHIEQIPTNYTIYPMLNKGDTALPFEPYTGGIPSPNPIFQQEINSAGDDGELEVGVYGRNLLPYPYAVKTSTANGVTFEESNGQIVVNGSPTHVACDYPIYGSNDANGECVYFPKGNYTMTLNPSDGNFSGEHQFLAFRTIERGNLLNVNNIMKALRETGLHVYHIFIRSGRVGTTYNNLILKPVVSVLESATFENRYDGDKQSIPISTPNGLPGIKVTDASLATYTDSEGNMWCADEIDFERGVYVKRLVEIELTGNEEWVITGTNEYRTNSFDRIIPRAESDGIICTHYRGVTTIDRYSDGTIIRGISGWQIFICDKRFDTIDAFTEFLANEKANGNPVICYCRRATPIETSLTESELNAYKALHTNCPVTTILNDSGAYMEVKYNADTKSYIDNKFTELTNAILSMGGNV